MALVSAYIDGVVTQLQTAYGGWHIQARNDEGRVDGNRAWSVEIGLVEAEFNGRIGNPGFVITMSATVRYTSKAATHNKWTQGADIAFALATGLVEKIRFTGIGEAIEFLGVEPVAVEKGRNEWMVTWRDTVYTSPSLDIEGYTVTSPTPRRRSNTPLFDPSVPIDEVGVTFNNVVLE